MFSYISNNIISQMFEKNVIVVLIIDLIVVVLL